MTSSAVSLLGRVIRIDVECSVTFLASLLRGPVVWFDICHGCELTQGGLEVTMFFPYLLYLGQTC